MSIIGMIKKWFRNSSKANEANAPESPEIELFIAKEDLSLFYPESEFAVTVDEEIITCKRPNGMEESIRWVDIKAVIIETNDQGPKYPDVFFLLMANPQGVLFLKGQKETVN